MTTGRARDETRTQFGSQLDALRREAVQLGALVLENVQRLTEALTENNLDMAAKVIASDIEIDQRYSELEHKTFQLIALQQPVAGDLRFLVSITRMLYEIERSGDLAVNSAKGLIRSNGYSLTPPMKSVLARLCRGTVDMFSKALDALAELDTAAALALDEEDDVVDDLVAELYAQLSSVDDMSVAIDLSRNGRYLERIADHGVNIGDHVVFIVTGAFPRHVDPADTDED